MNVILEEIVDRLHKKDQNFLPVFCGPTGSGKSFCALRLAEVINPDFKVKHVAFTVEEFYNILNKKKLKQGDVIVWEELGVAADSRQYHSVQNRAISYTMETFRHLNLSVIMTLPGLGMMDSNVRKLMHMYCETAGIDYKKKVCRCRVYEVEYNSRYNKLYFKFPRRMIDGIKHTIECIDFEKPEDDIIRPYLRIKRKFTKTLNVDLAKKIDDSKVRVFGSKPTDVTPMIEEVLKDPTPFIHTWRGKQRVDGNKIAAAFKIGETLSRRIKNVVERELGGLDAPSV